MIVSIIKKSKILIYFVVTSITLLAPLVMAGSAIAASRYEVGISTNATLLRMNDVNLDKRLGIIERLGAKWIRIDFSWPAIQPDNSYEYHWSMYDRVVRVAGVHHLKILAVLDYTPGWAQEPRCKALVNNWAGSQKCNPMSNGTFAYFARVAALRYKGSAVRAWEIWNEPNLSSYWKTARSDNTVMFDPVSYARLANAAAYQISHVYPDSIIISGGMAPTFTPTYPKSMRQSDFLKKILPILNKDLFDGIGIHPYSWPALPTTQARWNAFYTIDHGPKSLDLRYIMVQAGWKNKQIWGTEFGASTKGVTSLADPTLYSRPDHVSEKVQAQIVTQGVREWYKIPNVGPLFFHTDSDQWLPQHKNEGGFGMLRTDGSKKPSFGALQYAATHL